MAAPTLRVTCLPAGHGDAILVEYGPPSGARRILVDGGPAHCYGAVRDAILALPPDGRRFELLVVSHIDADHIDGTLLLLQDDTGAVFDDVWFNGWPQLEELDGTAAQDVFAPAQGEFLGALLTEADLPWNAAFGGGPVVVPDSGPLPVRELPGGARVVLLSPRPRELRRLRSRWRKALAEAGQQPGDWQAALERLATRTAYRPKVPRDDVFADPGRDSSVANGASIAFVLEYRGATVLLGADAHAGPLTAGLQRLAAEQGVPAVPLDAVKLPHHGSIANVDPALLSTFASPTFLVSTDGAYFGHPSPETIRLLGQHFPGAEVRFNHLSDSTRPWAADAVPLGLRTVYPPDGAQLVLDTR